MDGTEAVAFVDVVVAQIGYFVTYRTNLRLAQRNDRLERINRQLSEFYGPLLALTRQRSVLASVQAAIPATRK